MRFGRSGSPSRGVTAATEPPRAARSSRFSDRRSAREESPRRTTRRPVRRTADECIASAAISHRYAELIHEAIDEVQGGRIVLGRIGGDRQRGRLEAAAELFDRCALRDDAFAGDLGSQAR
jgi:uncharacterized membrane protein